MSQEREEKIRERAYEIWRGEGRPAGREQDHWDRARREVDASEGTGTAPKARRQPTATADKPKSGSSSAKTRTVKREAQ